MGGRIYLTKGATMTEILLKNVHEWYEFEKLDQNILRGGKFASSQSIRLGLK